MFAVKAIYVNNKGCKWGLFPLTINDGVSVPFVRYGTKPVAVYDTEQEASLDYFQRTGETYTREDH